MAKSTQAAADNKKQKSKKSEEPKKSRVSERSYILTPEALDVLDVAKSNNKKLSLFVSECIVEHGRLLLKDLCPADKAPLATRLKYIEDALVPLAYEALWEKLTENKSLPAHKKMLKEVFPTSWWDDLKKLREAAAANPKTKDTKRHEWITLIRMGKEFLE